MIYTYLDLSTAHLKERTISLLDDAGGKPMFMHHPGWPAMTIANYAAGVFVTVPSLADPDIANQALNLPPDLYSCIRHAHVRGIHLLRFDEDAELVEGLNTYA